MFLNCLSYRTSETSEYIIWSERCRYRTKHCSRQGTDFTGTSIVHVKYAREVADCYGQNVIMKWFDLFSEYRDKRLEQTSLLSAILDQISSFMRNISILDYFGFRRLFFFFCCDTSLWIYLPK